MYFMPLMHTLEGGQDRKSYGTSTLPEFLKLEKKYMLF